MPDQTFTFTISDPKDVDTRLDHFLIAKFPHLSRNQIQKAVKNGTIQVNHKKVPPHHFLRHNEIITGTQPQAAATAVATPNSKIRLDIKEETPDYLIVDKPAGLITHQSTTHPENDTLVNALLARYPELIRIGDDALRPGIVHRLDREVSGLMIIARTQPMFEHLKKQFQDHTIYKEYTGVVHGTLSRKVGEINLPIARSLTRPGHMAARTDGTGRAAATSYEVISENPTTSVLKIVIHTGRTHQIRVHLSSMGYPLVGDELYQTKHIKVKKLGRVLLHATKLRFTDLAGGQREYVSQSPFAEFMGKTA
ncbi:MAG: hypothetical protein A3F54_02580 [Candidatus Kerfeldbacteria bacterium RIFCSPHIGHO2_12_FULL_48_17]|uniref:Pseudouridine synthase n=1 Tax=Candidatus Kerfeldbacteria bacterium RIFCSPHIGHO2_12_FULL_48_17 TaxID=1798542 RepID=A0A1G2AZV1_9BACT|nr:MAG: hypothetical protein A3F54_02580 [Candidatus Kerfeldbacteria bacterium RIFCSPHIGHO2_12_FULL_48_17]